MSYGPYRPSQEHSRDNSGGEAAKRYEELDRMSKYPIPPPVDFSIEKRIELFAEDLIKAETSPGVLVPRFHHLIIEIRKEANKKLIKADIRHMKSQQSWYQVQERVYHFRETLKVSRRFDFDQLLEDVRKCAIDEHISLYFPQNFTVKKEPMRTIDELKNEIDELKSVRIEVNSEIEVINAKNRNAQAKRDRITAKIDGLEWMLDENGEQESAG